MNQETESAPVHAIVHTPGPWIVMDAKGEDGTTGLYVSAPNGDVCDLYSHRRDEHGMSRGLVPFIGAERNARLIAAAPDLLYALRQCLTNIEQDEYTHNRAFGSGNVARDAIEKATGVRPEDVV